MTGAGRPSEDELIARWFRPLATDPAAFDLRDDCAALTPPPGHDLVLKTDAVAAGIHFFKDDPWDAVARKALRVNVSDLAAKGARPLGYLLSLALPADWMVEHLDAFAAGLAADQAEFGLGLLGGDTIRAPSGLVISVTVIGAVPHGGMVRRGGARPGDIVFVSGTIGDAALGLQLRLDPTLADCLALDGPMRAHLGDRYLLPRPRLALAPALAAHASAGMDVSDGLVLDLRRMCAASGVTAVVDLAAIPLSPAAQRAIGADSGLLDTVVTGGDDYEILAAVAPERAVAFRAAAAQSSIPVAAIGRFEAGSEPPRFIGGGDHEGDYRVEGFRHF